MCNNCLKQFNCPFASHNYLLKLIMAQLPKVYGSPFVSAVRSGHTLLGCSARKPDSLEGSSSNMFFEVK